MKCISIIQFTFVCIAILISCNENNSSIPCEDDHSCPNRLFLLDKDKYNNNSTLYLKIPVVFRDTAWIVYKEDKHENLNERNNFIDYYNICSCLYYQKYCGLINELSSENNRKEYLQKTYECAVSRGLEKSAVPLGEEKNERVYLDKNEEINQEDKEKPDGKCVSIIPFEDCGKISICGESDRVSFEIKCSAIDRIIVFVGTDNDELEYRYLRFSLQRSNDIKSIWSTEIPLEFIPFEYRNRIRLNLTAHKVDEVSSIHEVYFQE